MRSRLHFRGAITPHGARPDNRTKVLVFGASRKSAIPSLAVRDFRRPTPLPWEAHCPGRKGGLSGERFRVHTGTASRGSGVHPLPGQSAGRSDANPGGGGGHRTAVAPATPAA